jgi:hypothetical protein
MSPCGVLGITARDIDASPALGGRVFMGNTTPAQRSCIGRIGD